MESPSPQEEVSWSAVFTASNGRFSYNGNDGGPMPLLRGDYRVACHALTANLPPGLTAPGTDGKSSSHGNRLRVPEDYMRPVQLMVGPLD